MSTRRFPFGIPTGWFQVAWTSELEVGAVRPLRYFARDLVLFRGADGVARVLDAHCPHLGAHLGHGGTVAENALVCPFHAWEFDGGGRCTRIPYAERIPKKAELRAWTVDERNGLIMVWHDAANRPPLFTLPVVEEYNNPGWTPYRSRQWKVKSCNQELAENQVDAAHFRYLHGTTKMPVTHTERDGFRLTTQSTTSMSTPFGEVDGAIEVNAWGFGFTTTRFTGLAETFLIGAATPIDEETTELRFTFTVRDVGKGITGGIGKAFMAEIGRQLEQDIPIWENKVYVDPPLLCEGDGPIGPFRAWARQFYPAPAESST
jgi:phenylpropionate dioxygenase-like ring-hydroxylating dioxygenase large terminal subunit